MIQRTFVIIKPDAISRKLVGKIIQRFEDVGFKIENIKVVRKNTDWLSKHYAHIYEKYYLGNNPEVYNRLAVFMAHDTLIGIILRGDQIITRARRMIGAVSALEALPGTIRGDFGCRDGPYNLVHASSSVDDVKKEIDLFFNTSTDVQL